MSECSKAMPGPLLGPFVERAAREPERPALIGPGTPPGGVPLSHGELAREAFDLASRLRREGVGERHLVALAAPTGGEFVLAFLALRAVGACVAMLDASLPGKRRHEVARDLGVDWIWELDGGGGRSRPVCLGRLGESSPARPEAAVVKLTSGSTGRARGILVDEAALAADAMNLATSMGITPETRLLVLLPLSHSYGFSVLLAQFLAHGSALVLPGAHSPLAVAREHRADVLPSVPAWFRTSLAASAPEDWACLRLLISAGAPLPPAVAARCRETTGRAIHVLYGSSEIGGITYDRRGDSAERGTVGTPVDGVHVDLIERDDTGVGRVRVRSAGAGVGYWPPADRRDLRDGVFETSDRATWEGDELRLTGRIDGSINVRGKKVDPDRVARAFTTIEGVLEAAVVSVLLPGDQGEALRAVAAVEEGGPRPVDLLHLVAAELAPHEIPRGVVIVKELPRTERGKLDPEALRRLARRGTGEPRDTETRRGMEERR